MSGDTYALAIHGGAGPLRGGDHEPARAHLERVTAKGGAMLREGASALDVVAALVKDLEASGLYVAGKGASPNSAGRWEMDAAVMDGERRRAGAVAVLCGFESPIEVARGVMERTPYVMLAGAGADAFAAREGFAQVKDPESYYTPAVKRPPAGPDELAHGTVGAVARDRDGRLATATSTGGLLGKMPGRVGDAPMIGAGTWADERVAVSCTGQGEYFIRAAVAADLSARIAYGGMSVDAAAAGALADMQRQGGDGGLIAVDAQGLIAMPFVSQGMRRGWLDPAGQAHAAIFR